MNSLLNKPAQELRDMWQARALAETKGRLFIVVLAVVTHEWPTALTILMRVVFPGFRDIERPFICSYATITATGKVIADVVPRDGRRRPQIIYDTEGEMVKDFRDLADRLKLNDTERVEMTGVLKKWVAADRRINHMGEKVA